MSERGIAHPVNTMGTITSDYQSIKIPKLHKKYNDFIISSADVPVGISVTTELCPTQRNLSMPTTDG